MVANRQSIRAELPTDHNQKFVVGNKQFFPCIILLLVA